MSLICHYRYSRIQTVCSDWCYTCVIRLLQLWWEVWS